MASSEVISVFLASPGDVSREREVAREVIDDVNRRVAKHFELHVELYGWEDQPPGYGRPQAQINPHVDEADLFIGMLWRRWGTPSGEEHSSGFEEEYQRARKRREDGEDRPEVWLFFKDVDDGQLADAGPELLKVLDFRRQIQETREALYASFKDEDDWRQKLYPLITEFVAKWQQARQHQEPERAPDAPVVHAGDANGEGEEAQGPSDASRQLVEALEGVRDVVTASDGAERPELFKAARLLLASFRWVSELQTGETLDTHELNLLYRYREQLAVLTRERFQLLRSMLTGEGVRPGWFWMVGGGSPAIPLAYLATTDANADVRRRAVETLGDAALLVDVPEALADLRPEPFLRGVLDDADTGVRIAALELAGRHASDDALELLRALQDEPTLKGHAAGALARALLQRAPDDALDILSSAPVVAVEMTDELLAVADTFGDEAVARLLDNQAPALRSIGLRIEHESGRLTEEKARAALGDEDMSVRGQALDAMQARGWEIPDEAFDEVVRSQLFPTSRLHERRLLKAMTRPREALQEDANWYLPYGETAYEAFARMDWEVVGDRVRRDLDDRFEAFRGESMDELRRRFGELGVEKLGTESEHAERYFARAALSALGENGTAEDAERVRPYLTHERPDVRGEALVALRRLKPDDATEEAVRIALSDDERAEARLAAARTALELSPAAAVQLMESADTAVASLATAAVPESEAAVEHLTELLRSEKGTVREAAAKRLADLVERVDLEGVLRTYMEGHYYYNVVVWLDRFLYCPEPFLHRYSRE